MGRKVTIESAKVIARRGAVPFVTTVETPGRGRIVWLGVERTVAQLQNQLVRDLLEAHAGLGTGLRVTPNTTAP